MIFPTLEIRALIVVTVGSTGLKNFPSYATIWITKDLEDVELIEKIIFAKKVKNDIQTLKAPENKKYIEAYNVRYKKFQYFPTLEWILNTSRQNPKFSVDLKFFSTPRLGLFFDIYTKLYIGFLKSEEFLELYKEFELKAKTNMIIVTIEKVNQTTLDLVYYVKETNGKLKRIRLEESNISIKDKELDGFTNAEVRFFMKILQDKHHLTVDDIKHIQKNISLIK